MDSNYNFMVYHNRLEYNEKCFFNRIIEIIINFPSLWYNFVENVLKNKVILMSEENILIFSFSLIDGHLKDAFEIVYNILDECNIIEKVNSNNDFLILYLNSKVVSEFFHNTGFWLEYLTAYACMEIGVNSYRGVVIKTKDNNIQEIDVMVDVDNVLFFIECKDTYIYNEKDFNKLNDLMRKIDNKSFGLFVVTKLINDIDYNLHGIEIIKYNYNYFDFIDKLKEIIMTKLLSVSF